MFYDTEERQASLRLRCQYDQINQSQFFRIMLTGYIEKDKDIMNYIEKFKEKYKLQGQKKRTYIKNMHKRAHEIKKAFALDKEDIESIFDILENKSDIL